MEIFKLVVSYLENFVSVTTSEPMTFFNISSLGDLGRCFAKFIVNILQRHNGYVLLSMLYCLKHVLHQWCVSELQPLVIYLRKLKSISMYDLGTSTMRLELGNLALNIERRVNKVKGAWPHWTVPSAPLVLKPGPDLTAAWHRHTDILLSMLMSMANGLLNDTLRLVKGLSAWLP